MPCPSCKADIDSDSIFCDQCGVELNICPKCHSFLAGKFCGKCGVPAVKASQAAAGAESPQPAASQPAGQSATASPQPVTAPYQAPVSNPAPQPVTQPEPQEPPMTSTCIPGQSAPGPQRLVCQSMGISLPLQPGAIIGRVSGNYVAQLGICKYLSGTHARLDFDGSGWTITDLGSTNGTVVNGIRLTPGVPVAIQPGSFIKFATAYDFLVQ